MFETVTDSTYGERFASVEGGICIFYKKLCPHCKNMEKVMQKFQAVEPDVALLGIDVEENPAAAVACDAQRVPTLLIIKNGKMAAKKTGLMNPRELQAFYFSA